MLIKFSQGGRKYEIRWKQCTLGVTAGAVTELLCYNGDINCNVINVHCQFWAPPSKIPIKSRSHKTNNLDVIIKCSWLWAFKHKYEWVYISFIMFSDSAFWDVVTSAISWCSLTPLTVYGKQKGVEVLSAVGAWRWMGDFDSPVRLHHFSIFSGRRIDGWRASRGRAGAS